MQATNNTRLPESGHLQVLQSALRQATRDLHHRLDHHPLLAPLVRSNLDVQAYGAALQALYAINAPTESRIDQFITANEIGFDYAQRRRMPDLAADLETLKLPVPEMRRDGPTINSPGELVGCLYVLEGSALGGRVIFRQIKEMLQLDETGGARFFAGHGEETMIRWQEFWDFAATICPNSEISDACQAAAGLFEHIITGLDQSAGILSPQDRQAP